ncbi:transglycosylase domain-containing protein [Paenibacillus thermotolerans]|uniref:transglycosylase domain-containing protein n=1 Tax=Paenibacillus thermotolerans TaxID=3027807 RepID=UPI00236841FE|nr:MULTISPECIES: penicillin-binding protein 1A [unclassified Paenibacillus]
MKKRKWLFGFMSIVTLGLLLFIVGYAVIYLNGQKLLMENLGKLDMAEATIVYDKNGKEMTKLLVENRELVTLDQIPDKLEEAVVATEDQRFGEHSGIDLWSIGRAIYKDILHRDLVEGGSTITQQVAKNMFLTADKTFFRKATEMSMALALENNFTKEQILEMYLNRIYFGNGTYGVKAAAKYHFGKSDLEQLNLLEIAVLAGIPKAPETYSPTNNPVKAKERAAIVLQLMEDQGYITEQERREALNSELGKPSATTNKSASAVRDYILSQAEQVTGLSEQELRIGGYKIYTTVDSQAQRAMDNAFANPELFPEDGPKQKAQGAMVIVDVKTGGIAAMNGGRDYVAKGLNRALANRQPGSSFKPVAVYAPALETGKYTPYSMLKDEKTDYGSYKPRNLNGKYAGEVTMLEAVKKSINSPAVWLLNEIGVKTGMKFVESLGIDLAPEDRNLAIALGGLTHGASPLEMARAYGAFANGGKLAETHIITKVEDSAGVELFSYKPSAKKVMSEQTAYYTTVLLQSVVQKGGTGVKANFGRPLAGKTGTTQLGIKGVKDSSGNRDIWFVGYTPEYAAAVWMGFDETDKEHFVKSGSGVAAQMFAKVMSEALKGHKETSFTRPEGIEDAKKPPAAIQDLQGMYDAERLEAALSWTASTEKNAEYKLYRKEASEEAFQMIVPTDSTQVVDISLEPGKTYQYYVTVVTEDGKLESAPSNTVEITVPAEGEGTDGGLDLPDLDDVLPGGEDPNTGTGSGGTTPGGTGDNGLPNGGQGTNNGGTGGGATNGNGTGSGSGTGTNGGGTSTGGSTGGTGSQTPGTPNAGGTDNGGAQGDGTIVDEIIDAPAGL